MNVLLNKNKIVKLFIDHKMLAAKGLVGDPDYFWNLGIRMHSNAK